MYPNLFFLVNCSFKITPSHISAYFPNRSLFFRSYLVFFGDMLTWKCCLSWQQCILRGRFWSFIFSCISCSMGTFFWFSTQSQYSKQAGILSTTTKQKKITPVRLKCFRETHLSFSICILFLSECSHFAKELNIHRLLSKLKPKKCARDFRAYA